MKGVTFGDVHTSQFGIYLSSVTIGEAAVREYKIEIPGASGMLDLTDYFGVVPYENRLISFDFTFPQRNGKLLTAYSDLQNAVHGKKLDITLDDNPNYHYVGRVKVGELKKGPVSVVTVECDCEPFKYGNIRNTVQITVDDIEYPTDWLYGDIDGDAAITSFDLSELSALRGKQSYESLKALRADYDFDGVVSDAEYTALKNYCNYGTDWSFKDYIELNPSLLVLRNCKRKVIDFGTAPVDVTFSMKSINETRLWEMRIDNITHISLGANTSKTMKLFGKREIMITTANTATTGVFEVSWCNTGGF